MRMSRSDVIIGVTDEPVYSRVSGRRSPSPENRSVSAEAGMLPGEQRIDAHRLKPVQPDELLRTIHRVPDQPTGVSAAASAPVSAPSPDFRALSQGLRILVAEDNEFNAQILQQLLRRRGHRVW